MGLLLLFLGLRAVGISNPFAVEKLLNDRSHLFRLIVFLEELFLDLLVYLLGLFSHLFLVVLVQQLLGLFQNLVLLKLVSLPNLSQEVRGVDLRVANRYLLSSWAERKSLSDSQKHGRAK